MKCLRVAVWRKGPEAWTNNTWTLHHDHAPAHASLLIREFLTKHEMTVVAQLPYSPDLDPADFLLFPRLKSSLKGSRFQTVEEIEENSIRDLRAIPQNRFQDTFHNWKKRWERCIKSGGEYFEGDKFDWVVSKAINLKESSVSLWTALVYSVIPYGQACCCTDVMCTFFYLYVVHVYVLGWNLVILSFCFLGFVLECGIVCHIC